MPTCSEAYGAGWTGTYPNCTYSPSSLDFSPGGGQSPAGTFADTQPYDQPFTGTVSSLDYGGFLEGSKLEKDWQKYFDPYDPEEEQMFTKAWDIKGKQLGKSWELKGEELSAGARAGYGQVRRAGSAATRKSDLAFSGTIADIERQKRGDITESYERSFGLGKTAYEQAMISGGLGLEANVAGLRRDWRTGQRSTLNMMLGMDIWPEDGMTPPTDPTPPGGGGAFNPYDPSDEIEDIVDITTENPPEESCPTGCVQGYAGCVSILTGQPC